MFQKISMCTVSGCCCTKCNALVILFLVLGFSLGEHHTSSSSCPIATACPIEKIYNGCNCFAEWNDANSVGNWSLKENWLQLEEPSWAHFVSISGDNTITTDVERRVTELYVGPNRWDTTRLVIDEDLTIVYDDVPVISRVHANRLPNGQTRVVIQGKGFGFVSEDITVTAAEYYVDHEPTVYNCEYVTLTYRDAKIECNVASVNLMPSTFKVQVTANGQTTEYVPLSEYIK